ncbi:hypothetical protein ALC56_13002 [Trachymyrmex septentrionalis]|uniref:Uncharacterized protein n=1 Tax=Trachymyrmex septentrionalis TaxID=34720 RepID=A0A195EWX0_9HYME|nr:hypothetical protein ALC56_13002 [Trachymyrmex septentrionalis]
MGVLRWRHDLRSEAATQQQQEQQQQRAERPTGHNSHTHTFPKLLSQVNRSPTFKSQECNTDASI